MKRGLRKNLRTYAKICRRPAGPEAAKKSPALRVAARNAGVRIRTGPQAILDTSRSRLLGSTLSSVTTLTRLPIKAYRPRRERASSISVSVLSQTP